METINGYELLGNLKTTNSGFSRWGFAKKNGSTYFIKELIDPVYPVCEDLLDPAVVDRKKKICQQFEDRTKLMYQMINDSSDGNLVYIEDFFRRDSHYYVVMEKIDGVGMDVIRNTAPEDKLRICKALAHCLGCLHKKGIVHGDIKLDNILFRKLPSGKVTAKVIDFDNCFWEKQPPRPDEEIHGDLVYMAPETFMMMQTETGTIGRGIDVFALGIVLHQIFTGKVPGFDTDRYDYPFEATLDGATLAADRDVPEPWGSLIGKMLNPVPEKRITLEEVEETLKGRTETAGSIRHSYLEPGGDLL